MKSLLLVLSIACLVSSCRVQNEKVRTEDKPTHEEFEFAEQHQTEFIHSVYFWMNDGLSVDQIAEFEAGMVELLNIETIVRGYYGPPAMTPRDVVDNSYDYAFIVHFNSKDCHDKYQVDSLHLNFIENYKTYWDSIRIYDNLIYNKVSR